MIIRPGERNQLVDVCILRCGRDIPMVQSQSGMIAKLLRAFSEKRNIVNCGGVIVNFLKRLNKMPSSKIDPHFPNGIQTLLFWDAVEKTEVKCDNSD